MVCIKDDIHWSVWPIPSHLVDGQAFPLAEAIVVPLLSVALLLGWEELAAGITPEHPGDRTALMINSV